MKRQVFLMAIFTLLMAAVAVSAQEKATDFSGNWELDVSKSKLGDRMRIESMTMNVSQTGKDLKVETTTKRAARPEGDANGNGGGMNRGGGMGRGGMMGGDGTQSVTYSLDGKETKATVGSGQMSGEATLKAKTEKDGKLKLSSSRAFNGPAGEVTITTKENWELTDGGKTLKVTRDTESPRGAQTMEMVFNKK